MALLVSSQSLTKSYSSRPLFRDISITLDDKERTGLIGPNGAGKSTLLKIIAGLVQPDDGALTTRKHLRVAYVPQDEKFPQDKTVAEILASAVGENVEVHERDTRVSIISTELGFEDPDQLSSTLSGGWRKRLSIGCQLIKEPELLLLDEPTNHLDLQGVLWLEQLLTESRLPFVLASHDRTFLENVCNNIVELNPAYAAGYLSVPGDYVDFLLAREQHMAAQANLEQALASKLRREIAWLSRGARARQKKSSARTNEAAKLMEAHAEVKTRNAMDVSVDVEFSASGRKTKELLVAKDISKNMGGRTLFGGLSFALRPGTRLGILGENGSGKTTLLRIMADQLKPDTGSVKRADGLRVVMFDQNRDQLDQTKTLKEALCPSGDSVVFQDRSIHVATWSRRFLFKPDQLRMPISYLSGGEQARILIANLMLMPADILILDEPTNDLDIPSLEVLEDSLLEFPGAIVLVTHDRFMLDNVSNVILALDGDGGTNFYADYEQSQTRGQPQKADVKGSGSQRQGKSDGNGKKEKKRPLSTNEKRELADIEKTIETAEADVTKIERKLTDSSIASNHSALQQVMRDAEDARAKVKALYDRWQDLERRNAES